MPAKKRRPSGAARRELAEDWRVWVVENLLRGVEPDQVVAILRARGVPGAIARREVRATARSPALVACAHLAKRARRAELVTHLLREAGKQAPDPRAVERRATVTAEELFERYYAGSTPVVVTEMIRSWPAISRWSPGYFREHFGDAEIEATAGRESDPDYDMNFADHSVRMRMRDLVDSIEASGKSNDLYLVANNRAMERASLEALLGDIEPDERIFDRSRDRGGVSLWLGPAGTVTPLHYDPTNIFFCQIYGRKRVHLVPPWELALLEGARGYYSRPELSNPDFDRDPALTEVTVKQVQLEAGEALFIPAGWWHHVEALTTSVSLSLLGFRRPNALDWYRPGDPSPELR